MITDKQGQEWVLRKLYDAGWRYVVADNYDNIYLTNEKPSMYDDVDEIRISSCKKAMGASAFKIILPKLKCNEYISIAEKLGIVNWSEVPVDTPILVSKNKTKWERRYFAKYEGGAVFAFRNGATSWSDDSWPFDWDYAKLAEV